LEEYGHVVLLRIFDCVDDTVVVNKTITVELKKDLFDISKDAFGRLVLLQLLSPLNRRYLPPGTVDSLQPAMTTDPEDDKKQISTRYEWKAQPVLGGILAKFFDFY